MKDPVGKLMAVQTPYETPVHIELGLNLESRKVAFVFDRDVRTFLMTAADARRIGLMMVKAADALEAVPTVIA